MPSSVRPGAAPVRRVGPPSQAGNSTPATSKSKSLEEINALPSVIEEGDNISVDPLNAHDEKFGSGAGALATITAAKFEVFQYPGEIVYEKEVDLLVTYRKEGSDRDEQPERYKFDSIRKFGVSKDGNFVKAQTSLSYVPQPFKRNGAVLFMQSLKDANFDITEINRSGASVLVGLKVHVRRRRVEGQSLTAKASLLVDFIEGNSPVAGPGATPVATKEVVAAKPAKTAAPAVPAVATAVDSATEALAVGVLKDILAAAENNTLARSQVMVSTLSDKWKAHPEIGAIRKVLRSDDFINKQDGWIIDGTNLILA